MKRRMFLFAFGYFIAGAYLVSLINSAARNFPDTLVLVNSVVGWIALIYVVVAFIFNVIDRRRNK